MPPLLKKLRIWQSRFLYLVDLQPCKYKWSKLSWKVEKLRSIFLRRWHLLRSSRSNHLLPQVGWSAFRWGDQLLFRSALLCFLEIIFVPHLKIQSFLKSKVRYFWSKMRNYLVEEFPKFFSRNSCRISSMTYLMQIAHNCFRCIFRSSLFFSTICCSEDCLCLATPWPHSTVNNLSNIKIKSFLPMCNKILCRRWKKLR